jgi:hypothetical protein
MGSHRALGLESFMIVHAMSKCGRGLLVLWRSRLQFPFLRNLRIEKGLDEDATHNRTRLKAHLFSRDRIVKIGCGDTRGGCIRPRYEPMQQVVNLLRIIA